MRNALYLFLIAFVWSGCQTTDTVENPASTHFIKFYGRDGDQTGRDLVILPDGSMVLFGTTTPTPIPGVIDLKSQWYVVKVDAKGTIIWEWEFGGAEDEEARDIELMTSGDLVLAGNSYKTTTDRDVMVMILSASTGVPLDSARIPTSDVSTFAPTTGDEDASSITEVSDGFIIAGTTTYVDPSNPVNALVTDTHDAMKLRLNTDLTVYPNTWKQIEGKGGDDGFIKVIVAPAGAYGSYYAFGYSNINNLDVVGYNYWILYLGVNGDPAANAFYSGTSAEEKMSSFAFTGSQFLMSGLQVSSSTDLFAASAFLPQSDTLILQFEKTLSLNLGTSLSGHTSICQSVVNGGFYVLGEENGFNSNQNWFLTRLNNDGTKAWAQPIVYGGEGLDAAGAVKELPDGRVVIIGTMRTGRPDAGEYKMTLVKVNRDGKFEK